jgi:hypothetical protein
MAHGVRTVVNLELLNEDEQAFRQAAGADTADREIGLFRLRDSELTPKMAPTLEDNRIAWFLAIVSQQPKPIYVHCRDGQNRTGVMVAAYRMIEQGVSPDQAIKDMKGYDGYWFDSSARYLRGLTPQRIAAIRQAAKENASATKEDARVVCAKGACSVTDR